VVDICILRSEWAGTSTHLNANIFSLPPQVKKPRQKTMNHAHMPQDGQRHGRSALVLYGSETGNSQDAAEELGRIAERLHFATRVSEMNDVEIVSIILREWAGQVDGGDVGGGGGGAESGAAAAESLSNIRQAGMSYLIPLVFLLYIYIYIHTKITTKDVEEKEEDDRR